MQSISDVQSVGSRMIVFLSLGRGMIPEKHSPAVDNFMHTFIDNLKGKMGDVSYKIGHTSTVI